jgi:PD-(D/E)XK nuclease superfamily
MKAPLYLDASAIKCWLDCREQYRLRYVENRVSLEPSFHQSLGVAIHLAAETHNRGGSFEEGLALAATKLQEFPEYLLNPDKRQRFRELAVELPSMVACYFDSVEVGNVISLEEEWAVEFIKDVYLCGRKDKVEDHPAVIFDLKTASEIGRTWKSDFRNTMLRDFGVALYDWHECQIGRTPETIKIECLVKPYKGKECRLEIFNLPEITQYRKRFAQQLEWIVREIRHYHENYAATHPWPMAQGQCHTKYGVCEYLEGCNQGWTAKTLDKYTYREEHLNIRKESELSNVQSIQQRKTGEFSR